MRVTRDTLMKIAHNTAGQYSANDSSLICIYLTGSLLSETPLLGGTADIDLICVHNQEPHSRREVVRLTEDIHLDVAHLPLSIYHQPRHLRLNPWVGSYLIADPILLYDTRHWFEFTQASVAAQFYQPENVLGRVRPLAEAARQDWLQLSSAAEPTTPQRLLSYLHALESASNAIACFHGAPLTERRFWTEFPRRAEALDRPGLIAHLAGLVMTRPVSEEDWNAWLIDWENAFATARSQSNAPVKLSTCRLAYYKSAIDVFRTDLPLAALWMLLRTWTLAASCLRANSPAMHAWQVFCQSLALDETGFSDRLSGLDVSLDNIEETIDQYARQNGI